MEPLSVVVSELEPARRINSVWYSSDEEEEEDDAVDDGAPKGKSHRMSFEVGMMFDNTGSKLKIVSDDVPDAETDDSPKLGIADKLTARLRNIDKYALSKFNKISKMAMGKSTRKDGGDAQSDYTSVGVISDAERLAIMMKVGAGELTVDEAQEAIHKLELDAAQAAAVAAKADREAKREEKAAKKKEKKAEVAKLKSAPERAKRLRGRAAAARLEIDSKREALDAEAAKVEDMLAQLAEMDAAAKAGTAASGAGAGVPTDGAVAAGGDDDDASAAAAATEALSNIDSRRAELAAEEQAVREAFRNQMGERFAVSLSRVEGSLGFVFATDSSGEKYVESITEGGVADGKMMVDDIIDAINGEPCGHMDHRDAVDIIRATSDPVVLGIVRARAVTEEQAAKDEKEVPQSRGNCGNCGHEVWTTQPRYHDGKGQYFHDKQSDCNKGAPDNRGKCGRCKKIVWTTQRRYHNGEGQYWHEDESYCRRQIHKSRLEHAKQAPPGSIVAQRAIATATGATALPPAVGTDGGSTAGVDGAGAGAGVGAEPGDGSDSPRTVPKNATAAKAHTVMHSPRFSVRKMFQSKSAKAAAAKESRDQQRLNIMHRVSAGEITAADASVQIKALGGGVPDTDAAAPAGTGAAVASVPAVGAGAGAGAPKPSPYSGTDAGAGEKLHLPPAVWLRKKAATLGRDKKRYFVLVGKDFRYFQDSYNGHGVNQKGTIDLADMTDVSADGKTIKLATGVDEIGGNYRVWLLAADTADVAQTWVAKLQDAKKDQYAEGADAAGNFAI